MKACPGDWAETGQMAPEPCATLAITEALDGADEWILDGFPRSARQLGVIRFPTIIYLETTYPVALRRALSRGRASREVENYRIREQGRLLAPVKALAAVVINTTYRTPDQVLDAAVAWLEQEKQPRITPW